MKFKNIEINNFRNFEQIHIDLENKNVLFGLNDIGKTNFLYALRFLFDRDCRKNGLIESDFYQKDITREIEITVELDISDNSDSDDRKIRKWMVGAIQSGYDSVFMQLKANFVIGNVVVMPELFWGSDKNYLEPIPSTQAFYAIDRIFNIVYIDSSVQLNNIFKHYTREVINNQNGLTDKESESIRRIIDRLNRRIAKLQSVKGLEKTIKEEYTKYRKEKEFEIEIRSELQVENVSSKLVPYINYGKNNSYPTSGDGRKKLLAYAMLSLENRKYEDVKINIFLVEELENHLHRAMQMAISKQLFLDNLFKYLFLTTHSPLIVSWMDDVNLIKLFKTDKTDGKSIYYTVPAAYKKFKAQLNQNLTEAIYADYVLLVEGPSEKILFETIMTKMCPDYELLGGYILVVNGINFKQYYDILKNLRIKVIIKTDNDLKYGKKAKEYNYLGLNRVLPLIGENKLQNEKYDLKKFESDKKHLQEMAYNNHLKEIHLLEMNSIYLSKIDLENDLYEVISNKLDQFVQGKNTLKNAVEYLQEQKMIHMIELCQELESTAIIKKVLNSDRFKCLKELYDLCNQ